MRTLHHTHTRAHAPRRLRCSIVRFEKRGGSLEATLRQFADRIAAAADGDGGGGDGDSAAAAAAGRNEALTSAQLEEALRFMGAFDVSSIGNPKILCISAHEGTTLENAGGCAVRTLST
jgi:hypothetical protein